MTETLKELFNFFKNPTLEKDLNTNFLYRLKKFFTIFFVCLITSFFLTIFISIIEKTGLVNTENHSVESLYKRATPFYFFMYAVIFAPLIEEAIFRAPLTLFKQNNYYKIIFYLFATAFGLIHIINYEISLNILLFAPILIAPQMFIGLYLGFIRIKFGLLWSIALHSTYNGFLFIIFLIAKNAVT